MSARNCGVRRGNRTLTKSEYIKKVLVEQAHMEGGGRGAGEDGRETGTGVDGTYLNKKTG